jgi:hypothetical protein
MTVGAIVIFSVGNGVGDTRGASPLLPSPAPALAGSNPPVNPTTRSAMPTAAARLTPAYVNFRRVLIGSALMYRAPEAARVGGFPA